jgi:hypothetical protein
LVASLHLRPGPGHRHRHADLLEHLEVEEVIPDVADLFECKLVPIHDLVQRADLAVLSEMKLMNVQIFGPLAHGRRISPGQKAGEKSRPLPVDETGTIVHVEDLGLVSLRVEVQAPVRHDTVDVQESSGPWRIERGVRQKWASCLLALGSKDRGNAHDRADTRPSRNGSDQNLRSSRSCTSISPTTVESSSLAITGS